MTATTFATAATKAIKDSEDLEILPIDALKNAKSLFYASETIPEDVCISRKFNKEENFFYTATLHKNGQLHSQEIGVAELYSKGRGKNKKSYIKREKSLYFITSSSANKTRGDLHDFDLDEVIVVETYIPERLQDLFVKPNSIPCSIDAHLPTIVELEENCLVGRMNDIIQSIDKNELWSILMSKKNPSKPSKGSIRYNSKKECFEGYNGKSWRALMWGE